MTTDYIVGLWDGDSSIKTTESPMNIVKILREEKGCTQEQLGKKLGVQKSVVSEYETGKVPLTDDIIKKLSSYFNVTADYLIGSSNNPAQQAAPPKITIDTLLDQEGIEDPEIRESIGSLIKLAKKVQHNKDLEMSGEFLEKDYGRK